MTRPADKHVQASSTQRRKQSERTGRLAEWTAAALLTCKGYRILAWRERTPLGEIDLIAARGRRLAFIEVKFRRNIETARRSIGRRQAQRLARAAEHWTRRHRAYRDHRFGFDAIYVTPWRLPVHHIDALQPL